MNTSEKVMGMKTIIIGGGKGCRSLISLLNDPLMTEVSLNIVGVVDINDQASGMVYARELGLKTFTEIKDSLALTGLEMIIELTGKDSILQELYRTIKPGIKIIDHSFTHVFWDLMNARIDQSWHLKELENLEMEVEKERSFLQQIFDSNADLVAVLDKDLIIKRANANFCKYTGMTESQAIGSHCSKVLGITKLNCDVDLLKDYIQEIFETGERKTVVRKTPPPDETFWEIIRAPLRNNEGKIEFILTTWHKITEKILMQREIESAEMKFQSFINSAKDWISLKDLSGRYQMINTVTAKAFNLSPKDFIGKKPNEILSENLVNSINNHDDLVIKTRKPQTFNEILPVNGVDHNFQTIRFPLNDYKGEIIGVCTIARDVDKEVKLQEQLIQSEKLVALGKLAAGVAHEINNPLTGILAFAEDLAEDFEQDNPVYSDLQVIIRETLRCRDIVRNLLDFSRQDAPKLQITNTNAVVNDILNLVKKLPQFKDINIIFNSAEDIPNIQSDPQQLQQVILNLMLNAADAMKFKGKLILKTECDVHQEICVISVEDTGPGIPENLLDKIFEPFFSTKGTNGLGLAVSWGIIERHRGSIEVDTGENGGAIFRIILPIYKE